MNRKIISDKFLDCIPQNDLDCYYNTEWKKSQNMSNRLVINNFSTIQEQIDDHFYKFIMADHKNPNKILKKMIKLRDSFYARTDYSTIISNLINNITNITNISELANIINIMTNMQIFNLFTLDITAHHQNPDIYTLGLGEIMLTFDDKDLYKPGDPDKIIKDFEEVLIDVHTFIKKNWNYNISDAKTFVTNIIVFEILASKSLLSRDESMDPHIMHNSMDYINFINTFDTNNFWRDVLKEYVTPEKTPERQDNILSSRTNNTIISYNNPKYLYFLKNFIMGMTINDLLMIKDYLVYCVVKKYGIYTNIVTSLQKISTNIPNKTKNIFTNLFYQTFGYYFESLYEKANANIEKNKIIKNIFDEMKTYCLKVFIRSDIFSKRTKAEAIKKLEMLDIIVGKQDFSIDLARLPELSNDFYNNLMIIHMFYTKQIIKLVGTKVTRKFLSINNDVYSFLVNAYYDPITNIIYIPTSIMNDIFIKTNVDPIYNYGAIGCIIGHEMMHCFDNHGAHYDHLGHVVNWWTPIDYEKFNMELDKVRNHYATLRLNDNKINTDLSMGENIADIAGLKLSFRTYIKKYLNKTKNFTRSEKEHLKLFFARWAQTLRTVEDNKLLEYAIKMDVHSPFIIRINAPFSHFPEYYEIFDVEPHHFNYLETNLRTKFLDMDN